MLSALQACVGTRSPLRQAPMTVQQHASGPCCDSQPDQHGLRRGRPSQQLHCGSRQRISIANLVKQISSRHISSLTRWPMSSNRSRRRISRRRHPHSPQRASSTARWGRRGTPRRRRVPNPSRGRGVGPRRVPMRVPNPSGPCLRRAPRSPRQRRPRRRLWRFGAFSPAQQSSSGASHGLKNAQSFPRRFEV
jgi:hypothetical protein